MINRVGFSYSENQDISRETFYLFFFNNDISNKIISEFSKNLKINSFESLDFLGVDFYSNQDQNYKIYSKILNYEDFYNFILKNFKIKIENNLKLLLTPYLFVRRLNFKKDLIGIKLEFHILDENKYLIAKILTKKYGIKIQTFKQRNIILALNFDLFGNLNKISFYSN